MIYFHIILILSCTSSLSAISNIVTRRQTHNPYQWITQDQNHQPRLLWPPAPPHLKPIDLPPDALYAFRIDTRDFQREEIADGSGNVRGRYAYVNGDGTHDFMFQTGEKNEYLADFMGLPGERSRLRNLLMPSRVYKVPKHRNSVALEPDLWTSTDISVDGLSTTIEIDASTDIPDRIDRSRASVTEGTPIPPIN